MDNGIKMETIFGDGPKQQSGIFDKLLSAGKRVLTGESLFMTAYTNQNYGKSKVSFAAPYPGKIVAIDLSQFGGKFICQKSSFLCAAKGVSVGIEFSKKLGRGFFGGVEVLCTGVAPVIYRARRSLVDGLVLGLGTDVLLIVGAIVVAMRTASSGVLLGLSSLFPTLIVLGLLGWLGIAINVGAVMAPCVALGVTVDDSIHFMVWFRNGVWRGLGESRAVLLAWRACVRPIYQNLIGPSNQGGNLSGGAVRGNVLGLNLRVARNLATAAPTGDNSIITINPDSYTWYESSRFRLQTNVALNGQIEVAYYGYVALATKVAAGAYKWMVA